MNFKKNFKRFFTLSRSAEGFTLVELIVVIAILGILVGVGMPAYGSYVEAANKGVDRNNLAIVNNAFAVACIEWGVEPAGVSNATLTWTGKAVTGVKDITLLAKSGATSTESEIAKSFAANIGTGGIEFKMHVEGEITFSGGKFVSDKLGAEGGAGNSFTPDENGNINANYGSNGGKITINVDDLNNLEDSTFIKSEGLGTQGLLDKVNDVTGFAAGMAGSDIMNGILGSQGFQQMAAGALGLENPDQAAFDAKFDELAAQMMAKYPDKYKDTAAAKAQLQANAAVLYAAQNAASMNKTDITATLSKENAGSDLLANLKTDSAGTLSNAALAYGMYTAYAYSTGDQTLINNTTDYKNMATYLNDEGFRNWVGGTQGQKDMDAYLSALNMINSSAKDENAVSDLMVNGFNDPALVTLLNQAMGAN